MIDYKKRSILENELVAVRMANDDTVSEKYWFVACWAYDEVNSLTENEVNDWYADFMRGHRVDYTADTTIPHICIR